jgi:hypothetical protein
MATRLETLLPCVSSGVAESREIRALPWGVFGGVFGTLAQAKPGSRPYIPPITGVDAWFQIRSGRAQ